MANNGKTNGHDISAQAGVPGANGSAGDVPSEFNTLRKQLGELLYKQRRCKAIMAKKQAEIETIAKLVESEQHKSNINIRKFKRLKERIEFRLATEAKSLGEERDLIRKIGEIDAKLDEAYKIIRLKRRSELLAGDIVKFKEEIETLKKQTREAEAALDAVSRHRRTPGHGTQRTQQRQSMQEKPAGINIEDIAIIKKKPKE